LSRDLLIMIQSFVEILKGINDLLTVGIAITAFSLLLYALSFNLRDRVARSFAIILLCVVFVSVGDSIASSSSPVSQWEFWMRFQWIGIIFLPPAYLHFSDALLETTGRPSRGRRRRLVWILYGVSFGIALLLPTNWLVGPMVNNVGPAPHLQRTWLTWVFAAYYIGAIAISGINLWRAYQRTVTRTSRRRMRYLLLGALAPVLGSYPFLLFGSSLAANNPLLFWFAATLSNLLVSVLLVLMAYAVAFFGVSWPDRVVKRRLFKWLMRGPVTASIIIALVTVANRYDQVLGLSNQVVIPILMVTTLLILEHLITLVAPFWERWLFHGGNPANLQLIQSLEERLLTTGDLRDFLESVLAALCDRLQVTNAFIVVMNADGSDMLLTLGDDEPFEEVESHSDLLNVVATNGGVGVKRAETDRLFTWHNYWLTALFEEDDNQEHLSGIIGVERNPEGKLEAGEIEAIMILSRRAEMALIDIRMQQQVFTSVEALNPQVEMIQRLRAAARYDGTEVLTASEISLDDRNMSKWVKDALSHYWGGPKLSKSPLMKLEVVQQALDRHEGNPTNALRSILLEGIQRVRPGGERRFTGEWILYNILDLKFLEGRKVREIAMRLAMSEADLYRKQRVAIEAVADAIIDMEQQARKEENTEEIEQGMKHEL
jgi:hypothetical protein